MGVDFTIAVGGHRVGFTGEPGPGWCLHVVFPCDPRTVHTILGAVVIRHINEYRRGTLIDFLFASRTVSSDAGRAWRQCHIWLLSIPDEVWDTIRCVMLMRGWIDE